jgi:hypothetical protein
MPPLIDVIFLQGSFGKKVAFDGGSKGVVSFSSSFKRTALKKNVSSGLASASSGQPITIYIYIQNVFAQIYPCSQSSTVSVLGE